MQELHHAGVRLKAAERYAEGQPVAHRSVDLRQQFGTRPLHGDLPEQGPHGADMRQALRAARVCGGFGLDLQ